MPSNPGANSKFIFNPSSVNDNPYVKEMRTELEKLNAQIQDLCDRVVISNAPWFEHFIKNLPADVDLKEVKVFGKALVKYTEIKPRLDEVKRKLAVIDGAKSDPDLMALAFGDTSDFGDKFTEILQGDNT